MKIKTKLMAVLAAALIATAAVAPIAFADDPAETEAAGSPAVEKVTPVSPSAIVGITFNSGSFTYKVTSASYSTWNKGAATVSVVSYNSGAKKASIPATVTKSFEISADPNSAAEWHNVTFAVTEIGADAFNNAKGRKVTKVTIGANVKAIGDRAFKGCKKLKKVVIKGESIMKVGGNKGSVKAKKLTKLRKKWKTYTTFKNVPRSCKVYVPKPQGFNFGYAENIRQLFGFAGFKGRVLWNQ